VSYGPTVLEAGSTRPLVAARAARGFADGFVSVLLAQYLHDLGLSNGRVGVIVTGTLVGSAALTLYAGLRWSRYAARTVLLASTVLMAATGVGFAAFARFWPLLLVAVVGTLNPSAGDVSLFLPTEQSALAELTPDVGRAARFAVYNLAGGLAGAIGALASPVPRWLADWRGADTLQYERYAFGVYVVAALVAAACYRRLRRVPRESVPGRAPLHRSRRVVVRLSALFSLDAAGGGFAVQSLLVLYLAERFHMDRGAVAATLFATTALAAFSQLVSARLAARIGLVRTMVFTHLPANGLMILAGIVPSAPIAIGCLVARSLLSSMDVPARQALVMAVVEPEERAAAASVTNVPRSLATAATPALAGWLLDRTVFGWPLVIGGAMKAAYDLLLYRSAKDHLELR
jgi:predicted MFS family arabinose efflux permease